MLKPSKNISSAFLMGGLFFLLLSVGAAICGKYHLMGTSLTLMFVMGAFFFKTLPNLKTFAFTFWVFAFFIGSLIYPKVFMVVGGFDQRVLIVPLIQIIMFGMGATLSLKDFANAIKYDPLNDVGYANRGLCYRVLKKFDRSLQDFERAIKINPSRADNFFGRAQTYHDMRRYDLARGDCERALGIHPDHRPSKELIKALRSDLA